MTKEKEPVANTTASAELVVSDLDLATTLSLGTEDEFPPVFATSRMIALMEVASARVLLPYLGPGELSVGTKVDVVHSAATPQGITVSATARYVGRDGKLFVFEVVANDDGGEIGRGKHWRAIVSTERLLSGAALRNRKV
ncbi:MAG TPA: hypothetical protein VFY51_09575 [Pyrinomonadaceae bacterium]|nr:hypothetical protein [Pyrinomonadaceae bacterium]